MERRRQSDPPTPRELISLLEAELAATLPSGWQTEVGDRSPSGADAVLRLTGPDGRAAFLPIETKNRLDARDVLFVREDLAARQSSQRAGCIVLARYLSPRARETLAGYGISFMDATGNLRLNNQEPALFVVREGADSDPWRGPDRATSSLRGKPAGRVVRALVDFYPPWKMRDLATRAGTSLGSTARTVSFLDREALIERDLSNGITYVDWPALLERWAANYDLARRRRVLRLIAPRGAVSIEGDLREWSKTYALTGSLAAARWAPYAEPRLGIVYTPDADELRARLGLREAPGNPNLLLIEPDDDVVFERSVEADGLRLAAPSQVAVDLLTGPGRNPEEGRALIRWMESNEAKWRRE